MSEDLKNLTGKNPKDFEPVACNLINKPDVALFAELVEKEDFLFDFVKQNVATRLEKCCNSSNYKNLLSLLKYYSPSYEEFIVSTLVKFSNEDLTDEILEIFKNGNTSEKTYCAKYFSYIQDPLAIDLLKEYAYDDDTYLSSNCASTLAILGDNSCYEQAIAMLDNADDFIKLDAVRFLVSYGNKEAVNKIIDSMKKSSMAENFAGEVLYLTDWFSLYDTSKTDALYVLNHITNGLGEILGLSQVFDFNLYEILGKLINEELDSQIAVVLANLKDKFETLTENDEYLFDETKETKQEILEIKKLLSSINTQALNAYIDEELYEDSEFVYTALELTNCAENVRALLDSNNPTVVLKSVEILKRMNELTQQDKELALSSVQNEDIKNIICAI